MLLFLFDVFDDLSRGLVTDTVSVDASAEEMESTLKALPTVQGGLSVTREVSTAHMVYSRVIHAPKLVETTPLPLHLIVHQSHDLVLEVHGWTESIGRRRHLNV